VNISPAQIRAARAGLDWTQRQLAERAGVHHRTIKQIERGRTKPLNATASRIARAFTTAGVAFDGAGIVRLP
jgi:DNA-binding XRE family transcriptional regulator